MLLIIFSWRKVHAYYPLETGRCFLFFFNGHSELCRDCKWMYMWSVDDQNIAKFSCLAVFPFTCAGQMKWDWNQLYISGGKNFVLQTMGYQGMLCPENANSVWISAVNVNCLNLKSNGIYMPKEYDFKWELQLLYNKEFPCYQSIGKEATVWSDAATV